MNNHISGTTSPERYAPHLSEFYSIVNNTSPRSADVLEASSTTGTGLNAAGFKRRMTPASVRSGMSSISDLRTLVTKRDMKNTVDAMKNLRSSSQGYASSLREVSGHAGSMAQSLEQLARLKGCADGTAERFLSASGLFYLLANHENIMSQCLQAALGDGLLEEIDEFDVKFRTMENEFKKQCKEQSMKLKLQEKHNTKLSKRKVRNLMLYKESLMNLQSQLDHLEALRHDFYQDSYNLVESTCDNVLDNVATVSRAQVEISESIARKGWSGGGLDELLMDAEDPFAKEQETIHSDDDEAQPHITVTQAQDRDVDGDRNSKRKENGSEEPITPKKSSSLTRVRSPLAQSPQINATHEEDRSDVDEEEDEAGFDNSFSLPLAGSARSRTDGKDCIKEEVMLEGLSALSLSEVQQASGNEEAKISDQSSAVSHT